MKRMRPWETNLKRGFMTPPACREMSKGKPAAIHSAASVDHKGLVDSEALKASMINSGKRGEAVPRSVIYSKNSINFLAEEDSKEDHVAVKVVK